MLCIVQEAELEELGEWEGMNPGLHFADGVHRGSQPGVPFN